MNTQNLDEVLREYIDDGGNTKVYEGAIDELHTLTELNTPMPCGHLARYAVNDETGTQYCALCTVKTPQKVFVILYTFEGWDGEIDRLWTDDITGEKYLIFADQEKANEYFMQQKFDKRCFEIKEAEIL